MMSNVKDKAAKTDALMKQSDMAKEQPAIIFFSMWSQMYSLIVRKIKNDMIDVSALANKIVKLMPEETLYVIHAYNISSYYM